MKGLKIRNTPCDVIFLAIYSIFKKKTFLGNLKLCINSPKKEELLKSTDDFLDDTS